MIERVQGVLEFKGWESPQFSSPRGLGRTGLTGFLLGTGCGFHLALGLLALVVDIPLGGVLVQWSIYMVALTGFHFSEFLVTAVFKPSDVSYDSFVVNHSPAYTVAAIVSWSEFWLESALIPRRIKFNPKVFATGMILVLIGQVFRAGAMWTAKSNFNHIIMEKREENHVLVQHGVYRFLRHPSYFGFFWWSVGTQLLLCNPVCVIAYALAAWDFFRKRIPYEEATLCRFYPKEYPEYIKRSWIGIPCIPSLVAYDSKHN